VSSESTAAEMMSYLPDHYASVKEYQEITKVEGKQFADLTLHIQDALNQFFIDKSTWGVEKWEEILEIPTDSSKPIEQRRSLVKAKRRGTGKVDSRLIKNVADAYTNGAVEVLFDGKIHVKFTSFYGVPSNLEDLEHALRVVIPSHLGLVFEYSYLLIKDIHNVMTINELQSTPLNKFAGGES
jgi:hypothetical protein